MRRWSEDRISPAHTFHALQVAKFLDLGKDVDWLGSIPLFIFPESVLSCVGVSTQS